MITLIVLPRTRVCTVLITLLACTCMMEAAPLLFAQMSAERSRTVSPRTRVSLNEGWRFLPEAPETAVSREYDDDDWERVNVPHTWNTLDPFDKTPGYRRGMGTYRRRFSVSAEVPERRVFLEFEGANQVAEVYVNGAFAGKHAGGYTLFRFDVSSLLRSEGENVLVVIVDNGHDAFIPPLEADFNFYGGLYRDVWLIEVDPLHVDLLDFGGPGVYVTQRSARNDRPQIFVRTRVVNDGGDDRRITVRHTLFAPGDSAVVSFGETLKVRKYSTETVESQSPVVTDVRIWSPSTPVVYVVRTLVLSDDDVTDAVDVPFGFRTLAWSGEGFFLNGVRTQLIGSNRHQDLPGKGSAISDDMHRRDVGIVKENGFNFLRLAHYPQDPSVLEATDTRGLAVWEEIPVVNQLTPGPEFAENAERMLVEMIRQHFNHPSVVIWGVMNEALLRLPSPMPPRYREEVAALAGRLHDRAKQEDPTRPTALALSQGELTQNAGLDHATDIMGLNLYFGWYGGTFEGFGDLLDRLHRQLPGRPIFISEYGAGSDERVHANEPVRFDFSAEYMQEFHRMTYPQIIARNYLIGSAVWNQFDFGADHRQDTKNGLNQKGLYFFDRTPKDIAFYYRAMRCDTPVLRIEREHLIRAGSSEAERTQRIRVFTNADSVRLSVDGTVAGTRVVSEGVADFDSPLVDGVQNVEANGWKDGRFVRDMIRIRYDDRTLLFDGDRPASREIAVNAGGHYSVTGQASVVYEADRPFGGSGWGYVGGRTLRTHHRVLGTEDDPLYQATRDSLDAYTFAVPDGTYEVTLGFLEITHEEPGKRVFNVALNDVPFLSGLDLARSVGRWRAVDHRTDVSISGGSGLTIRFVSRIGNTTVSSIRLRRR